MDAGVIIDIVFVICVFWVFFDAANNHIGSYVVSEGIEKGRRKGFHPVVWAVLSMFIFPFFWYLITRKSMLVAAKEHPVTTDKSISFILLFLLVSGCMLYAYKDYLFY
ncbi:TPA: hypothetical protein U2L50_001993 [Citrobacter farmeri]|uniref:hypothetical protein n=1 Tax=Citrobacter TaxID=544 RepID=UPI0018AA472A|nr:MULTISPECIES: hypothetical protein [Citrobacter]HCD2000452.1 hypothetical protein [Citrobacter farmeri]HEM7925188.1 hypothetical protein [Citrobacter farmeri]